MDSTLKLSVWRNEKTIILISSLLITLFLFFLDEGYYNFKWMGQLSNWIVFSIYLSLIFGAQFLVARLFRMMKQRFGKLSVIIAGGVVIGVLIAIIKVFA